MYLRAPRPVSVTSDSKSKRDFQESIEVRESTGVALGDIQNKRGWCGVLRRIYGNLRLCDVENSKSERGHPINSIDSNCSEHRFCMGLVSCYIWSVHPI